MLKDINWDVIKAQTKHDRKNNIWKSIDWKLIVDPLTFIPAWKLQIGKQLYLPVVTLMFKDVKTDYDVATLMTVMKAELEATHPEFLRIRRLELKIAMLKYQKLLWAVRAAGKTEIYCPYIELQT